MQVKRTTIRLNNDPKRVIINYLNLGLVTTSERIERLIQKIIQLDDNQSVNLWGEIKKEFKHRHSNFEYYLEQHYNQVKAAIPDEANLSLVKKKLIGAHFTKEYSIQAAALFNPSIVPHPYQADLKEGEFRFIYTLRSVGEGHISSIEFRTGIVNKEGAIQLEKVSDFSSTCLKNLTKNYTNLTLKNRTEVLAHFNHKILQELPLVFTLGDYLKVKATGVFSKYDDKTQYVLDTYMDTNYDLVALKGSSLSERVIFPNAKRESKGLEDVRLVAFEEENGDINYIGTYTAYDGHSITPQLIMTKDFMHFKVRTMYGKAVNDKGMALFPEKINGKYVMLGRQGGENITIMYSDNLFIWDSYETLLEPEEDWGLIQLGNCGSPIKTKAGWLVITHTVGALRKYRLGAILLDLEQPSTIIKKLRKPLLSPNESEREGYVPNVVYSCGSMLYGDNLIIPYALSDSATTFATVHIDELIAAMEPCENVKAVSNN